MEHAIATLLGNFGMPLLLGVGFALVFMIYGATRKG